MTTFITKLQTTGTGTRLAVKDLVDVAGVPTTAGSRAVARTAEAAETDAACLAGARAAGARIVGKTNLHELAMLPLGTNPWFGTPVNPLDAALIPGGSSSGSAVAVATGEADVALGSDTGGSVRIPSACCGTAGLKTTFGRVPLDGVWPLAPSLDTVGPMAATVAGLVEGMRLLEPGFEAANGPARTIGRIRTSGDPRIEAGVDEALRRAGFDVVILDWDGLDRGAASFSETYFNEIRDTDLELLTNHRDEIGADLVGLMDLSAGFVSPAAERLERLDAFGRDVAVLLERVELLALPTMPVFPPRLDSVTEETLLATVLAVTENVAPFNAAGTPATAQPVAVPGHTIPASLQLVGPRGGEELLLATALAVEAAQC